MSVILQILIKSKRISFVKKSLKYPISYGKCIYNRSYSVIPKNFITFAEVTAQRRAEAKRSLVIQVNSKSSFQELYSYCSKYAEIKEVHHFKTSKEEDFMLIEFTSEENYENVLKNCTCHNKNNEVVALPSPFLWFKMNSEKTQNHPIASDITLTSVDGSTSISEDPIVEEMINCGSVSEQIQTLYDRTKLDDIGVRLRYMVARQLELVLSSLYSNIAVTPFGSSVNGFGKIGCDLDLVLTNSISKAMLNDQCRLVYQEKRRADRDQRQLELVAGILETRVAGVERVARILHARVPILKYAHELTGLDCDLCCNNMSGVHMSELLYLLGTLDARVQPLVTSVRRWASARGLTCPHPGRWVTNFPLTLMVLFFLQQDIAGGAILPPFKDLIQRARKQDMALAENNLNCTFLRDLNKLPSDMLTTNDANLETLLLQFFEFYSHFDFHSKAISIIEGKPIRKPSNQPLYIINPLETMLNVSKNVSYEECEKLRTEVRNAAWHLESLDEEKKVENWGLLGLTEEASLLSLKRLVSAGNSRRLISLKDLFKGEATEDGLKVSELRSKLKKNSMQSSASSTKHLMESAKHVMPSAKQVNGASNNPNKKAVDKRMKFKNPQIKSEVYKIRRNKIA